MIRGAIFDADGTLLDSMWMWDSAGERYLASLGVRAEPGLNRVLFPMSMAQCAVYLKETYRLSLTTGEIEDGINGSIRAFYAGEVQAKPGAAALLRRLREDGVRCVLATNTARPLILAGLSRTGLLPYLEEVYTCSELGLDKRTPEIFELARTRMGTERGETWVFEDAVHAARTAFRAGFRVAGVADSCSDQEELRRVCHLYLPDLTDLPGILAGLHA